MTRAANSEREKPIVGIVGPVPISMLQDEFRLLELSLDGSRPESASAASGSDGSSPDSAGAPSNAGTPAPRIVVVARGGTAAPDPVAAVRSARSKWPLVDCLAWVPDCDAAQVRALLQGGAKDVVIEAGAERLVAAIQEILAEQSILPRVDALASSRVRRSRFEGMLSRSDAMWNLFETTDRVAPTDANVLICGETGTGKELFARALHRRSGRKGRFIALNCSALPEHLVESELFGHEKGAFTGAAKQRAGIFRSAEGGTVFLDEIGDMPESAQQSLLRVLEERTVRPVGGAVEIEVDVRIVAATHVPLEQAVAENRFREDLFYRLDVIRLDVPPLRARPEDVVYLFGFFLKTLSKHYGVKPPEYNDAFLAALTSHPWPGNVRELENFSERVVLRKGKGVLGRRECDRLVRASKTRARAPAALTAPPEDSSAHADHAERTARRGSTRRIEAVSREIDLNQTLKELLEAEIAALEKGYLEAVLEATKGRMQAAADRAGISRRTLLRKLQQYGIDKTRFQ